MARKKTPPRDPLREYPDPTPVATPVTFRGMPTQVDEVKAYFQEWSRTEAENNHVETIEEANDFSIFDEEDEDFFHSLTPYEMHDVLETETQAQLRDEETERFLSEAEQVGSGNTDPDVPGASQTPDQDARQSAPDEEPDPTEDPAPFAQPERQRRDRTA